MAISGRKHLFGTIFGASVSGLLWSWGWCRYKKCNIWVVWRDSSTLSIFGNIAIKKGKAELQESVKQYLVSTIFKTQAYKICWQKVQTFAFSIEQRRWKVPVGIETDPVMGDRWQLDWIMAWFQLFTPNIWFESSLICFTQQHTVAVQTELLFCYLSSLCLTALSVAF